MFNPQNYIDFTWLIIYNLSTLGEEAGDFKVQSSGSMTYISVKERKRNVAVKERENGEMAQHLRALVALAENVGLIPRTHMMAHNHL